MMNNNFSNYFLLHVVFSCRRYFDRSEKDLCICCRLDHANGANSFEEDFYTDDVVDNLDDTLVASASVSSRDTSSGSHHHDSKSESRKQLAVRMERQVDILNHCFDDIEAFAQKLKHVHDAQKELDMRRQKKKNKQKLGNVLSNSDMLHFNEERIAAFCYHFEL